MNLLRLAGNLVSSVLDELRHSGGERVGSGAGGSLSVDTDAVLCTRGANEGTTKLDLVDCVVDRLL